MNLVGFFIPRFVLLVLTLGFNWHSCPTLVQINVNWIYPWINVWVFFVPLANFILFYLNWLVNIFTCVQLVYIWILRLLKCGIILRWWRKYMQKSFSRSYVAIITLTLWPKQKEMWNQAKNKVANLA